MSDGVVAKVEKILKNEFSMPNYVELVREIFSTLQLATPERFRQEYTNFSSHIEGSFHVGNYTTPDGKKVVVYAVQLRRQTYVENSRSTQRSYAKKIIENGNCDAALVAFYTPGDTKWRLSFVRLDYEMKIDNGKLKTQENLTPAKRYSYLVGKDEPCHTAIERFHSFIVDNNSKPTLDEMEEAFSVEAVTKEFFRLYCEKFYQLVDCLEANSAFKEESSRCGFSTEQFAKKLMGQIVFLYFLQKKGWLGVGVWSNSISEKEYKDIFFSQRVSAAKRQLIQQYLPSLYVKAEGEYRFRGLTALENIPDDVEEDIANVMPGDRNWGNGSKTFLRTWFNFAKKHDGHFYDRYLEPLFYATLNKNRGELGYSSILHCRIPFLSGGLFDPIDGYDWEHTDFNIPDEIFSNKKSPDDMNADGILDIFDRYNFTMSEDEPMEREVAIDPEMLGKVFENLLDVKDRKSKGAFYTPREIVHYMCQESLVHYLSTNIDVSESAIRDFILFGDYYKDYDTEKTLRVVDESGKSHYEFDKNRKLKISPEIFDPQNGINRIQAIDTLLKNIRVADPAVGSGAFPLGMLNEIVKARQNLSAYMATSMNANSVRLMYVNERSTHTLKYETIRNCIFAADVEPSAVDITQLRLWLALVIDDEINPNAQNPLDGHVNPLPLPNLECNILCGNSLSEEFEGITLVNQNKLIGTAHNGQQNNLFQNEFDSILPQLIEAQNRLFACEDTERKRSLLKDISELRDLLIMSQLKGRVEPEVLRRYEESKKMASKPYVLWHLDFARVFKEKGGFDIVIGNPPYLESRSPDFSDELKNQLQFMMSQRYGKNAGWFPRGADLLIFFFELSLRLINPNGLNTFITQNSWLDTEFGKKFQEYLLNTTNVLAIVDSDYKYFETADINTVITFFEGRGGCKKPLLFARCHRNLMNYSLPANSMAEINKSDVTYKVLPADSEVLREMKWGFIFNTEDALFNIIYKANGRGKTIGKIATKYEIGQGLNLKKNAIVSLSQAKMLGIPEEALIPFFTSEECEHYAWKTSSHYIVKKSALSQKLRDQLKRSIDIFDDGGTRKVPPALIMPRGIGARHYSCINDISGYSASGVDLYAKNGSSRSDDVLKIWLYTNSSLFWLIREIAGRKNLGGGMLKAEAVDLKPFAILFDFPDIEHIREIANKAEQMDVLAVQDEVQRNYHEEIDKIVFDYLELDGFEREYIVKSLVKLVDGRYSKTKA